jgi:hypothetical protein
VPAAMVLLVEISDAAAPATRAVENVRLFIIMIILFRLGLAFCSDGTDAVERRQASRWRYRPLTVV